MSAAARGWPEPLNLLMAWLDMSASPTITRHRTSLDRQPQGEVYKDPRAQGRAYALHTNTGLVLSASRVSVKHCFYERPSASGLPFHVSLRVVNELLRLWKVVTFWQPGAYKNPVYILRRHESDSRYASAAKFGGGWSIDVKTRTCLRCGFRRLARQISFSDDYSCQPPSVSALAREAGQDTLPPEADRDLSIDDVA